jgi:hypothetical protein
MRWDQNGLLSKMSGVFYPLMGEETLPQSFSGWSNAGIAYPGGYLTLNILESPKDATESLLSQVLETNVQQKYYLSKVACMGMIRRSISSHHKIPDHLLQNLKLGAEI